MSAVRDETALNLLAIPGSHDTMTAQCPHRYYRTQHLTLREQLDCGVRFLDIRLTRDMVAAHREWVSTISVEQILSEVTGFLAAHPSETVVMRLQNANEAKDDFRAYVAALHRTIEQWREAFVPASPLGGTAQGAPQLGGAQLGSLRGRIVALECTPEGFGSREVAGTTWAWDWHDSSRIELQDLWNGPPVPAKLEAITAFVTAPPTAKLRLNHISATNGALGFPDAYATILNPAVRDIVAGSRRGVSGIQIFDYVDSELAQAIYRCNQPGGEVIW